MYASSSSVEKCRLEGHRLDISEAYETQVPWKMCGPALATPAVSVVACVDVRSSMPLTVESGDEGGASPLLNIPGGPDFSKAVRSRVLQDLRLLPVRDLSCHFVERGNVSVYSQTSEHVLVVYAPSSLLDTEPQQLEFLSFTVGTPSS